MDSARHHGGSHSPSRSLGVEYRARMGFADEGQTLRGWMDEDTRDPDTRTICWSGMVGGDFYLRFLGLPDKLLRFPSLQTAEDLGEYAVIRNNESSYDEKNTKEISPRQYSYIRHACVNGFGISGTGRPGGFAKYTSPGNSMCTMAYDIEVDTSSLGPGEFPLMDSQILSIAMSCTCGLREVVTTVGVKEASSTARGERTTNTSNVHVRWCSDSRTATVEFFRVVESHMPLWLVGWNNYGFDNQCLVYHYKEAAEYSEVVRVGSSNMVAYGYMLNLPGTYNIDAYAYMSRARPGRYSSLSLKTVAEETGSIPKTDMPTMSTEVDLEQLVLYNVNDCDVTLDVWFKSGLSMEIPSLAACSSSPVYDCARYVTGTMMPLLLSSVALSQRKVINWSVSAKDQEYKGGLVLDPVKGYHKHVMVCDFSSMYPTIMACCNISPETVQVSLPLSGDEEGAVTWEGGRIRVVLSDCVATFPHNGTSLVKEVLQRIVSLRREHRATDPMYAASLKVCGNSMYGCIGYMESALYSPACSSSVTTIGRWCVKLAYRVFERCGLRVLYGDTDSCFVSPVSRTHASEEGCRLAVDEALSQLSSEFATTPLKGMTMEPESYHPGVILLDKKRYCKLEKSGVIKYTGVSAARRNTAGMVKETCRHVTKSILTSKSTQDAADSISLHLETSMRHLISGRVSVKDVSSIKSRDGVRCYAYARQDGQEVRVALWDGHVDATDVDYTRVLEDIRKESDRITVPCGLGTTYDVTRSSSRMFD